MSRPGAATARRRWGVLAAAVAGLGVAVQSRINGDLGTRLHDGIAAAAISFGVGLVGLLVVVAVWPSTRRGLRRMRLALHQGILRPWQCLGGVCGAFLVCTQGLTVTSLGVALFTVAVVAGQSASSLAVDRLGVGPGGVHRISLGRVVGAGLAIVAVAVAVWPHLSSPTRLELTALPALAGMTIAWQQAVNGQMRAASGSVLAATVVNFAVGSVALIVAFAVDLALRGWPAPPPGQLWLYLGGPLGVGFIAMAAAMVRWTGVLLLGLGMVVGQLVGALGLDLVAPTGGNRPDLAILAGIGITLVAVVVAGLSARPAAPVGIADADR